MQRTYRIINRLIILSAAIFLYNSIVYADTTILPMDLTLVPENHSGTYERSSVVTLKLMKPQGKSLTSVKLYTSQSVIINKEDVGDGILYSVRVSSHALMGNHSFFAEALHEQDGISEVYKSNTIVINVEPSQSITSIEFDSSYPLQFAYKSETLWAVVHGYKDDGTQVSLNSSKRLVITPDDPTVVSVSSNLEIHALKKGETLLRAKYIDDTRGIEIESTRRVIVDISDHPSGLDFDNNGVISNIDIATLIESVVSPGGPPVLVDPKYPETEQFDINKDGIIDDKDVQIIADNCTYDKCKNMKPWLLNRTPKEPTVFGKKIIYPDIPYTVPTIPPVPDWSKYFTPTPLIEATPTPIPTPLPTFLPSWIVIPSVTPVTPSPTPISTATATFTATPTSTPTPTDTPAENECSQISVQDAVVAYGIAEVPYGGTDTKIRLTSFGKIRDANGVETHSVWRLRNSSAEVQPLELLAYGTGYNYAFDAKAKTEYFIKSPIASGSATHKLMKNGSQLGVKAASTSDFSYDLLIDDPSCEATTTTANSQSTPLSAPTLQPASTPDPSSELVGEVGFIAMTDQQDVGEWFTVSLENTYTNPVVILGALSYNGTNPSTLRVKNVTENSFQYQIQEWDYLDGAHIEEDFGYVVIEEGKHTLSNGLTIEAGTAQVGSNSITIALSEEIDGIPLVFTQVASVVEPEPVVTRHDAIFTSSFSVKLQEEEGSNDRAHEAESVGWVAIRNTTPTVGVFTYLSEREVTHQRKAYSINGGGFTSTPSVFAAMQSTYGGDTSTLRLTSLSTDSVEVFVEEETSKDSETDHTTEVVGIMALPTGTLFAAQP